MPPIFRPSTKDEDVWRSVYERNEYNLKDGLDGAVVVDVGGHIGSFACACAERGAASIHVYEPSPSNFKILTQNCAPYAQITTHNFPITMATGDLVSLIEEEFNTGAAHIELASDTKSSLSGVSFIDALKQSAVKRIDVLKLDCEGSEWDILTGTPVEIWSEIGEVVGEYHITPQAKELSAKSIPEEWQALKELGRDDVSVRAFLDRRFRTLGFTTYTVAHPTDDRLGWFYARNFWVERRFIHNRYTIYHLEDEIRRLVARRETLLFQKQHRDNVIAELKNRLANRDSDERD